MDGALFLFYGDTVKSTIRQNGRRYSNVYLPKCDAANLKPSPKPELKVHVPYGGGVDGRHLRTFANFSINCDFQFNCYCNNFFSLDLKQQHLHHQRSRMLLSSGRDCSSHPRASVSLNMQYCGSVASQDFIWFPTATTFCLLRQCLV